MKALAYFRTLACLLLFTPTFARIARGGTNDIQVVVDNVTDARSTGNSMPRCSLQLRFSGADVADAFGIRDIRVMAAVDDTGRDLRVDSDQEKARRRFFPGNAYAFQNNPYAPQTTHMVELLSPERGAHTIKVLEGEVDLFFPTPENGGVVIIKNFLAHPGDTFSDPLLKKANVTITYLGKEGSEATTSTNAVQPPPTHPQDPAPAIRHIPFMRRPGQMKGLQFSIDDPDHRLADMIFVDSYGRELWGGMNSMGNGSRTYQFQSELPSNLQLRIYLATPEAIKTVPFKIEDIALP